MGSKRVELRVKLRVITTACAEGLTRLATLTRLVEAKKSVKPYVFRDILEHLISCQGCTSAFVYLGMQYVLDGKLGEIER